MTERYNVQASTILGDNYKITNIECSDYNPNIDTTVTLTITVEDVYGDAVSGESVLVTASGGQFTQLNGSDITSASSVTGTTNSSGQFTLTYTCTVWGLITFTANNTNIQICVTGMKTITVNSYLDLKVNLMARTVMATYTRDNITTTSTQETVVESGVIPSDYRPFSDVRVPFNQTGSILFFKYNGDISIRTSATGTHNVRSSGTWII